MELKIKDAISKFVVELAESDSDYQVSTIVLNAKAYERLTEELCAIQRPGVYGPPNPLGVIEITCDGVEIRSPKIDRRLLNIARKQNDEL